MQNIAEISNIPYCLPVVYISSYVNYMIKLFHAECDLSIQLC